LFQAGGVLCIDSSSLRHHKDKQQGIKNINTLFNLPLCNIMSAASFFVSLAAILNPGGIILPAKSLNSINGCFQARYLRNCNFNVYQFSNNQQLLWSAKSYGKSSSLHYLLTIPGVSYSAS
jgi:hypothetical protein